MADIEKIKKNIHYGIKWQTMQTLCVDGAIFILGIVLARLLTPKDFGIFAIVFFFVSIFETFSEGGMGIALVQKLHINRNDCAVVFSFNFVVGLICVCLIWALAGLISGFYKMPEAAWMLRVLSLKILVDNVRVVSFARLRRDLNFKTLSACRISATIGGGICGLTMAFFGCGVWSLVGQQLLGSVIMTSCCLVCYPWTIRLGFHSAAFRQLFMIGGGILGSQILGRAIDNLYTLIIGKIYSSATLGFYNRAMALQRIPTRLGQLIVGESGGTVMYRIQLDDESLRKTTTRLLQITALFFFPILFGIAAVAEPLIVCLLGEKWLPAAEYLPILCGFGAFIQLSYFSKLLYKIKGKIKVLFASECVTRGTVLLLAAAVCWYRGEVIFLLWSGVIAYGIGALFDCWQGRRLVGFGLYARVKALALLLWCNVFMYASVRVVSCFLPGHWFIWGKLLVLSALGAGGYVLMLMICRVPIFEECKGTFLQRLKIKRAGL